ncbi:type IV secretion system DNA-binding domain-containing protein [Pseudomonas sp. GX19020]|uniref:type IV secretion system DNA-binding domain-containing protein n=1 Tax=Pseudomonas sp. GX19020 TaxID=2942277 RepID=UPI0020194975|nr:type IV secretion system DNA-binding domain-containing protein [Pseudomonas sp. GX19020]MCL4068172.1 type IV secretion system DNA-binding domain-containing protein [Pseudomonas sp. GX19020]
MAKRTNHPARFVRGGQTTQHWWRMAAQVARTSAIMAIGAFTLSYCVLIALNYEIRYMRETMATWLAEYNISAGNPSKPIIYTDHLSQRRTRTSLEISRDARMAALAQRYRDNAGHLAWVAALPAGVALVVSIGVFAWAGRRLGENQHVRGSRLISQPELVKWSARKWRSYRARIRSNDKKALYTIANIPFPPNAVEAQTGIFGTVGVGKTNAIKELLTTIRERGGRAVIYDRMGGLVRDFYDPETDVIINPFDARSRVWSPFFEARTPEALAQIAEVMIPQKPNQGDPFWSQTARLVFEYAARSLIKAKTPTNADLRKAIMTISADELARLLAGTPGAHFFGPHVEKTSASIRANMIAELRFLEFLRDDGEPFSIRQWVKADRPGFVFLTGDAEHSAATRNVISTAVEVAANALMTCEERRDPSLWFFLDEVPTLNRLPFLVSKLAEVRQFGGAFVLGYQVYAQLEDIYGEKAAQSIAGTLNNRIVFNTPDARTAKLFSDSLGFEDLIEQRENLSFGAHESRDGVAFMSQRVERPIVTPSEIQALPQFEAFIRFAYDAPTAKVLFEPVVITPKAEKFIPYNGTGFDLDGMDPVKAPAPGPASPSLPAHFAPDLIHQVEEEQRSKWSAWPPEQQIDAFYRWRKQGEQQEFDAQTGQLQAPLTGMPAELLWDHYYRQRLSGVTNPSYRVTPNTHGMVSTRGKNVRSEGAPDVPSYSAILEALVEVKPAEEESPDQQDDPLSLIMDDRGALL